MNVEIKDLSFSYHSHTVLKSISLQTNSKLTAIIGPNAAGKSTFIKCLAGILRPQGAILLDGTPIRQLKRAEISERISYLPQETGSRAILTVLEAVLLGRLNSLSWRVSDEDLTKAFAMLTELGIDGLASKPLNELSGGQLQMVSIAQALIRDPQLLLMDEPTNSLDLFHQLEMFERIREITDEKQLTTIMALHDLNHAARYADYVIVLNQGKIYDCGTPAMVFTEDMITTVYGVYAKVIIADDGIPQIFPLHAMPSRRDVRASRKTHPAAIRV